MAKNNDSSSWHDLVAISTAIIAVLAAVASLQAAAYAGQIVIDKNDSILFQSRANKEWNNYFLRNEQASQGRAEQLEKQSEQASDKSQSYFDKSSHLTTSATFFEIALAISAMSILIKMKIFWIFSLTLAGVGVYFMIIGLV